MKSSKSGTGSYMKAFSAPKSKDGAATKGKTLVKGVDGSRLGKKHEGLDKKMYSSMMKGSSSSAKTIMRESGRGR